jgi:TPR repeat protein/serine/threonine protein kinase
MFQPNQLIKLKQHRYRFIKKIGAGGQSLVWRVERQSDKQAFALKTVNIFAQHSQSDTYHKRTVVEHLVERAWEEIEFFKQLGDNADQHAIVVFRDQGIHQVDYYPNLPLPVVIMDLYDYDLSKYQTITQNPQQTYAFSLFDLLKWAQQVSDALCFIHRKHSEQQPYVHRDLKPANIVVNSKGDAALTDFGIVRAMANIGTSSVVASYHYCAPEQRLALYRNAERRLQYLITPALDIYSLAITLHELLAGSTQAQDKLSQQYSVDEHVSYLPSAGIINHEKVGLLGEIGGLSKGEQQYLQQCVQRLFAQSVPNMQSKGETIAFAAKMDLPDQALFSQQFADLLTKMLSPWAADRPTADAVHRRLQQLQQLSQPTLTQFSITAQALADDNKCELRLTIAGNGLPAHLQWLQLYINGVAQALFNCETTPQQQQELLLPQAQTLVFHIHLPNEPKTKQYQFRVFAKLGKTPHEATTTYVIQSPAEQLWASGDYFAALQQEIRAEWLQYYQTELLETGKTFSNLKKLDEAYQQLQHIHPNNQILQKALHRLEALSLTNLNYVDERFSEPEKQPQSSARKNKGIFKKLGLVMVIIMMGLGIVWFIQQLPSDLTIPASNNDQAIAQIKVETELVIDPAKVVARALLLTDSPETKQKGLDQLEQLVAQNYPVAQFALGWMYEKGRGVEQNNTEAVRWYRRAAKQGNEKAQNNLGWMYENGKGVEQNNTEAVRWYRKAAKQGYARAQTNLGLRYEYGQGLEQSDTEAVKWYRKAAEQGNVLAQYYLGMMYENGKGVERSNIKAVRWYRKAAEQGYTRAQTNLGGMYYNGAGVERSNIEAVRWYRKAVEQGDASAQAYLGVMYEYGQGVEQSDTEAVKWYRKAAEQGEESGQLYLGVMYEDGKGVEQSYTEAVKWYRKAAEQDDVNAQNNLGRMYEKGRGVEQSDIEAVKWYRKAAEQGEGYGQRNLGWMYENGKGVEQSDTEAVKWYKRARKNAHPLVDEDIERVLNQ